MNRVFGLFAAAVIAALPLAGSAQTAAPPAAPAEQKVTITPYGFILAQAFWANGPFGTKDYPGQVLTNGDGGSFLISARGSRFGFRIAVPDDPFTGAKLSGVIEADFKAGHIPGTTPACTTTGTTVTCTSLAANSNAWYNGVMRLRLAYAQATWGGPDLAVKLVAGQDWSIVAPVNGTSLAWGYDPIFYQAGNLWRRAPQAKVTVESSGPVGFSVAAAATSPADLQVTTVPAGNTDYGVGNRSRTPGWEGRAAVAWRQGKTKVAEVGVSGAMQKRRYSVTAASINSFNDITVKLGVVDAAFNLPYVSIQGEGFLNDGYTDAYQGIEATGGNPAQSSQFPVAAIGATGYNIGSKGFFAEATLKPLPYVWIPVGYGVEQLKYDRNTLGIAATTRTKGAQFHTGLLLNMTNAWQFGGEWTRTMSGYGKTGQTQITKTADMFAAVSKLNF
ncbi:MAG TPA: hypothetical protein VFP65_26000 [Anaeromyxobacteraceae bacterium]|nr:hypothetical protein [Anaeromyxobacteraceae bacterium]